MLGQVYNVAPMAPDEAHTTWLDAGPLRLGVEYRALDPEALADYYDGDDLTEVEEHSPEGGFTDEGVSIHITSVSDDHEYLRFDVFVDEMGDDLDEPVLPAPVDIDPGHVAAMCDAHGMDVLGPPPAPR